LSTRSEEAIPMDTSESGPEFYATGQPQLSELLERIVEDLKSIGRDELALARIEIKQSMKSAITDTAAIVLGGIVALIGLGMLCVAVVAALEPVWKLWFRLVLMAAVYLAIGGLVAAYFARRLQRDVKPDMSRAKDSAERTVQSLREELRHG